MELSRRNRCNVTSRRRVRAGFRACAQPSGVTLIEAVVSSLLVGLLAVTSLRTSAAVVRSRQQLGDQRLATALCERYLTEVLQAYYQDPTEASPNFGTESGETSRNDFDDVDDYAGWSESPPKNKGGSPLSGYGGWSCSILVDFVDVTNSNGNPVSDQGLKRVTVTVTNPVGKQVILKGLRAKAGADEKAPHIFANYVQWIGLDLQIKDAETPALRAGTQTIDQAKIGN